MEDDRTRVVRPGGGASDRVPLPGAGGTNTLPLGTRLAEFEIVGLVGEGGFGIVYLAEDRSLGRHVALKEYMPSALASRTASGDVGVKSERHRDTFEAGLRSFVTEARILARFDHPSMVKVYRFWEERGTAYMAMPYYPGATLKTALTELGAPPDEAWLRRLLRPVADALECLHREQCLHRDIAPDNILLLEGDQRPVLLDFGAARRVIGEVTQALTVILKPGYAPLEQYAEIPDMQQGPWTDVYALAAVAYYAMSGRAPPPSVSRIVNDSLVPAVEVGRGRYGERFLRAIDAALAVRPSDRTPSIGAFREALALDAESVDPTRFGGFAPSEPFAPPAPIRPDRPASAPTGGSSDASSILPAARPATTPGASAAPSRPASREAPTPSRPSWWLGAVGALVAVAAAGALGFGIYLYTRPQAPVQAEAPPVVASRPVPDPPPRDPPPSEPPAPAPESVRYTPLAVLDALHAARDPTRQVGVKVPDRPVRIDVDPIRFTITSDRDGYLYVLMAGTDASHFYQIFPNALDRRNRIQADKPLVLPRTGWQMVAGGPPGVNELIALVSTHPRDFGAAGLRPGQVFSEFDEAAARERWTSTSEPTARARAFAGTIDCARDCDEGHGSARFAIREVPR